MLYISVRSRRDIGDNAKNIFTMSETLFFVRHPKSKAIVV